MPIKDLQHKPTASSSARIIVEEGNTPVAVDALDTLTVGDLTTTNLSVDDVTADNIVINGPAGTSRFLGFETSDALRWTVQANATAESGGNAGSDFTIDRYDDTGSYVSTPFYILRSTGVGNFEEVPTVGGSTPVFTEAGGTVTGDIIRDGAAGTFRNYSFATAGDLRWEICCDDTAEAGSDVGSALSFDAYDDAGVYNFTPMKIYREDGYVQMNFDAEVNGTLFMDGGRIRFPSTQNPSSNPNTLDDYEEGTWTPTLAFGGASVGITYGTRTGTYIKVGRMVTVGLRITLTNKGSSTGNTSITGMPFTVSNSPNATVYSANFAYWAGGAATLNPAGYLVQNSTTMGIVNRGGGAITAGTNADFTNTTDIIITATYLADA